MKEYKFNTPGGNEVVIITKESDKFYFGIYLTCEVVGVDNEWVTFNDKDDKDNTIKFFSKKMQKRCAVVVPEDIANDIRNNRKAACSNTGKIIVATVKTDDGEIVMQKFGKAIADPWFEGMVYFRMPEIMEKVISLYAIGGIIYDMGSFDEECNVIDHMSCKENSIEEYWYKYQEVTNPGAVMLNQENPQGPIFDHHIKLEVITPYED